MSSVFRNFYIVLPILIVSCVSKNHRPLTVLSYNIHHAEGKDTILDLERIARVINSVSPDMVALQEVDMNTERTGKVNQIEVLAKLTHMNFVFGKSIDLLGGQYGNAILSKLPIKSHETLALPGNEPRSALAAILDLGDKTEIVLISTHLSTSREKRLESIEPIEKIVKNYKDLPLVLAGDLNAVPESNLLFELGKKMKNATVDLKTSPADNPKRQIDYILYATKDQWSVESSRVLDEKIASDHRPVISVLKLN